MGSWEGNVTTTSLGGPKRIYANNSEPRAIFDLHAYMHARVYRLMRSGALSEQIYLEEGREEGRTDGRKEGRKEKEGRKDIKEGRKDTKDTKDIKDIKDMKEGRQKRRISRNDTLTQTHICTYRKE
jgi:hypothetical protein